MHTTPSTTARTLVRVLLCAAAMLAAGCHNSSGSSGYGMVWTTVTDDPGDYTSYITTITSVTLTSNTGQVYTAASTPEVVDFAQLHNSAELWSSSGVPVGTYTQATITLNYTGALIYVMVNGVPQQARLIDEATNGAPATYSVSVQFPADQPLVITPTYASTSAQRLAVDFNLAASGRVDVSVNPPVVYVRPFITAGVLTPDTKIIRVRGPLINSSAGAGAAGTYTVYIRPFYDEANVIGTISLFNQTDTVWTINGHTYVGPTGLAAIQKLSAGSTMTAGWTQFVPDYNPANNAYAGTFYLLYEVGASSLEDNYTEGISGDVIRRTGNAIYLLGATLQLNTANTFAYETNISQVIVGPATIVTADDNTTLTGLNSDSIAVGQHITARGIYSLLANGIVQIDATGNSSTNTGSVRLQSTALWGPIVSTAASSVVMDLQAINDWPVTDYNFAGNGVGVTNPAMFQVTTEGLAQPAGLAAPAPVWANGFMKPFGSAPPNATAVAMNNEHSIQLAGTPLGGGTGMPPGPGTLTCGIASQICEPASYRVQWTPGTDQPFTSLSAAAGFVVNLQNAALSEAEIRIGAETIDVKAGLPASPRVVATSAAATSTFSPMYTYGNPATATTTATVASTTFLYEFSQFDLFVTGLEAALSAANSASQMDVRGVYDRVTNTFTATSIYLVL